MGLKKDFLDGMTPFSGNDGEVVWPLWKHDLKNRILFELGQVAVDIVEGKIKEKLIRDVQHHVGGQTHVHTHNK